MTRRHLSFDICNSSQVVNEWGISLDMQHFQLLDVMMTLPGCCISIIPHADCLHQTLSLPWTDLVLVLDGPCHCLGRTSSLSRMPCCCLGRTWLKALILIRFGVIEAFFVWNLEPLLLGIVELLVDLHVEVSSECCPSSHRCPLVSIPLNHHELVPCMS